MTNTLWVVALLWPMAHSVPGSTSHVFACQEVDLSSRVAMGPDPGGHTGDTVTPSTTRTGQPVENGPAPKSESTARPQGEPAKQDTPPRDSGGASSSQGGERR